MARAFTENKLVLATHNPGKLREISALMTPFGIEVVSAGDLGLPEPVEDGDSFSANALIKARAAAQGSGLPALSDDSGLEVSALGGAPGIHSARWAGPDKDFDEAMSRIAELILENEDRKANFTCALALCWPDGHTETFVGKVYGMVVWPKRGDRGFGYDPMFVADGYDETFGEMDPAQKHDISHRAEAFKLMVDACFQGRGQSLE